MKKEEKTVDGGWQMAQMSVVDVVDVVDVLETVTVVTGQASFTLRL